MQLNKSSKLFTSVAHKRLANANNAKQLFCSTLSNKDTFSRKKNTPINIDIRDTFFQKVFGTLTSPKGVVKLELLSELPTVTGPFIPTA